MKSFHLKYRRAGVKQASESKLELVNMSEWVNHLHMRLYYVCIVRYKYNKKKKVGVRVLVKEIYFISK